MPDAVSSVIVRIRYREEGQELLVTFVSGRSYAYEGVPADIYEAFLDAPSAGAFFNEHVRDRYPHLPVVATRASGTS